MKSLRTALAIPALLLSACAFAQPREGGTREETREVADFQGVEVGGGLKAQVKVGPKSVRVSGDAAQVARVRTEVEDGKLVVHLERGAWLNSSSGVRLTISTPQLTSVEASGGAEVDAEATATDTFTAEASGGGEVSVRGMDAKRVKVEASGGAEVELQGRAELLEVEASGGSEVHGEGLTLKELRAEASGGTRVKANPSERLVAEASGGSSVHVDSSPAQREVSTSGGSKVVFPKK